MNGRDGKDIGLASELGRKAIHLFALVIPLGLLVVPHPPAILILGSALAVSVAVDFGRRRAGPLGRMLRRIVGPLLRPHEDARPSGATYILAAGVICPLVFDLQVAVAALICVVLGDTAAVFVGRYLGRIHIGDKTLEGTLGFFLAACAGIWWLVELPLHVKLIGSAAAAVTEALPLPVDDNLLVPLVAGTVMTALLI